MGTVLVVSPATIDEIIDQAAKYDPKADTDVLRRAYEFAERAHAGSRRYTGDPFITHPLAVAQILTELRSDTPTLAAALLHDVVEDCDVSLSELEDLFGHEVASLVDGVTKLKGIDFTSRREQQASSFRRMFVAMARDIRVVIIKLADRVHNMRTVDVFPEERRRAVAQETLQIFAPLAHRLGIWRIKSELEDLALKQLDPQAYRDIERKVAKTRRERQRYLDQAVDGLQARLEKAGIKAAVQGRSKHFYSIYAKMQRERLAFSEILDLSAIRVIVNTVPECYAALGVVHELWSPIPGKFTDFIARPKSNGYQSLHTKVIGPLREPLEVQIRTWEMHRASEYGVAAHWHYKEGGRPTKFDRQLAWLRQLIDFGTDLKDPTEFLETVKAGLFEEEVFVFTPDGDLIELPTGSTPVDFAYRVHTEVGHRCVGARVNGRMVPLSHKLRTGDIVEILTHRRAEPSLDWLPFARTAGARSKIRRYFRKLTQEENVRHGKQLLEREIQRLDIDQAALLSDQKLAEVAQALNYASVDTLYAAVGLREVSAEAVLNRLRAAFERERLRSLEGIELIARRRKIKPGESEVIAGGAEGIGYRLSQCCQPVPGDEIKGYITRGRGLAVHRSTCGNLLSIMKRDPARIVSCEWRSRPESQYQVRIDVEAIDRVGLLNDITGIVTHAGINIHEASVQTHTGRRSVMRLVLDISHVSEVQQVIQGLSDLSDVLNVRRVSR